MEKLIAIFNGVYDFLIDFWETCVNVLSYIVSWLWFIRYGWKTLIIWTFKLVAQVVSWSVFLNVNNAFIYISHYIWLVPTVFLSAWMLLAIIRILVAFIFKILRKNLDYNTLQANTTKVNLDKSKTRFSLFR